MRFLLPGEIDDKPLIRFLEDEGIERWRSESLVNDVRGAVSKYAQVADRASAKIQLEEFLAAAEKLEKTFAPVGSIRYVQLYNSIAAETVPRGSYDRGEVLRALESLPMALHVV
jgi:hypothetical protein